MEFLLIVIVLILLFGASAFLRGLGSYLAIGAITLLFLFAFRALRIETTTGFMILAALLLVGGLIAMLNQHRPENELQAKPNKYVDSSGQLIGLEAEIHRMDNRSEESTDGLSRARQSFLDAGLPADDFHVALIDFELAKRTKTRP